MIQVNTLLLACCFCWLCSIQMAVAGVPEPGFILPLPEDSSLQKEKTGLYPLLLKSKLTLSGYSQVRYMYTIGENNVHLNQFDVRRARFDLRGTMAEKFGYRMQIDFAPFTRVLDANISYTFKSYLKITAGQGKIPFSLENIISSQSMESINRSQVVEALAGRSKDVISQVANNNGRDFGVTVSGAIKRLNETNILEYSAGVFNGNGIVAADNNADKDISARIVITPVKGFSFGGSYYNGSASYGTDVSVLKNRDRFGGELYYLHKWISLKAEYLYGNDDSISRSGYYGQVAGVIIPDKLQLVFKYDFYDSDLDIANDATSIYTTGVNYMPNQWSKLQAAYDIRREEATEQINNDQIQVMLQLQF